MKMIVIKKAVQRDEPKPKDERSRSEYTLLWELMERNPERAEEFLRRLKKSMRAAA